MRNMRLSLIFVCIALMAGSAVAKSDYLKQFEKDYKALSMDLLNNTGERATIKNFVYQKDLATFTFEEGKLHLLRYVNDRPTTAIFIGKGHASIVIPSHVEKQSLMAVSGDTVIEEDFESCMMHIGDDFDLAVREKFDFEPKELSWKDFNIASKKAQGEFFFKPTIEHTYDNYFQLMRSLRERSADGYFWIDFNRYVFTFDPSRPEQVILAYEFEGGDMMVTDAAVMQRQENDIYDDDRMSAIAYPTMLLDQRAQIEMGGGDGRTVKQARTEIDIEIAVDSIKFMSLFLHRNLDLDSLTLDGEPVDFYRRRDFDFIGVILPEYSYAGDTLALTLWYHGKKFDNLIPWVENPAPTLLTLEFVVPRGYDYFMPGMGAVTEGESGKETFTASPSNSFRSFYSVCYPSGVDTVAQASDIGLNVNFLDWELMQKKFSDCYVPDEIHRLSVMSAFNFMASQFGGPPGTFAVWVSSAGTHDMPGIMIAPQIACVTEEPLASLGGYDIISGRSAARQWFGPLMRPATDRELWLTEAVADYAAIMFLQAKLGSAGFSNLLNRRDSLLTITKSDHDMPLASGYRTNRIIRANKGLWVLHMLRFMMYDLQSGSERAFMSFLQELMLYGNNRPFTNSDFVALAEKHYGQSLDSFFQLWLYGINYP